MTHNKRQTVQVIALCQLGGVGARLFDLLMHRFRSLDAFFEAELLTISGVEGFTTELVQKLLNRDELLMQADAILTNFKQREIGVVTRLDPEYPQTLVELNDPPPLLYFRGKLPSNEQKSVALLGAGEATQAGIELTVAVARQFAEANVQVVSSLRLGIDAAAHLGSKSGDHHSFAVLESGFDHIEQTEQMPLAIDVAITGGVISEYPPEVRELPKNMPAVNRLIVGLSHAVVITELYSTSTQTRDIVRFCRQIGKLLFVVVDQARGTLMDQIALDEALECGAIIMEGIEKVDDITVSLV